MSFDAHELRIKQIFSGDASFIIPRNQREYVWNENNWKDLANDIEYIIKMTPNNKDLSHFVGSFVFQQTDDIYTIIDGQQRITTFMIMLSVICVLQMEIKDEEEFGKTKQYLIGNIGLKSEYQRLKNESLTNLQTIIGVSTYYQESMEKKAIFHNIPIEKRNQSNKRLMECFWYFYAYFVELSNCEVEMLIQIRTIILDMKVIHIISQDELDCYEVFEILNARGVKLKDSELLKNYVFKYVQPTYTIDIAKLKWNEICDNMSICKDNIDQFLLHYFVARFPKKNNSINIFQIVKDQIERKDIIALLDELVICSRLYTYFYNADNHDNPIIRECLKFFIMENQRQFRPVFLAYLLAYEKGKIDKKELEKTFVLVRNFYFSYGLICKNSSNTIETAVYKVANSVYSSENSVNAMNFYTVFQNYIPSKETFIGNFLEKGYSNKNKLYKNSKNKKEIMYILSGIEEYYLQKSGSELTYNLELCNIEHINSDSAENDIPCKIGNLLLLSSNLNSRVADKIYKEKVEIYRESQLCIVKNFVHHYGEKEKWTSENIIYRAKKLAELSYEIWKFEC